MTQKTGETNILGRLQDGGLTWRVLLFSFPFCIAWLFIFFFGTYAGLITYATPPLMLMLLFEAVIIKLAGKRFGFTIQEWTVFITIAMSGLLTSSVLYDRQSPYWGGICESWIRSFGQIWFQMQYLVTGGSGVTYPLPAAWFPTDSAFLTQFTAGGVAPAWATWLPYILFWIGILVPFFLAVHFISTLFRKGFIEEEKLPFPAAVSNIVLLQMAKGYNRPSLFDLKSRSGKAFWLAFLVGGIWPAYFFGANFLTGSRNIGGPNTRWALPFYGGIQLSAYLNPILPGYTWNFGVGGYVSWFPIWYFISMDVLNSVMIGWAIFSFIIPGIMMSTGAGVVGQLRLYGTSVSPIPWEIMFGGSFGGGYGGFMFGLAAYLFWHYRKHITHTIQSAVAGEKREASEPYSWRFVWIGLVLSILVCYGVFLSSGMNPLILVNLLLFIFIVYPAVIRTCADVGRGADQMPGGAIYVAAMGRDMWSVFGYNVSNKSDPNLIGQQLFTIASSNSMELEGTGKVTATMTSYKYAEDTGTHSSPVGWAFIIATIIGIIFSIPVIIWMSYTWSQPAILNRVVEWGGQRNELAALPMTFIGQSIGNMTVYGSAIKQPLYQYWVLAGAIVTFALFWLHSAFSWFFFNPIAIGLAYNGINSPANQASAGGLIICWVAKLLTFKIGGAKAYDEVGVPAAVGYCAAIAVYQAVFVIATMGMY